jgi:hypothetical protein
MPFIRTPRPPLSLPVCGCLSRSRRHRRRTAPSSHAPIHVSRRRHLVVDIHGQLRRRPIVVLLDVNVPVRLVLDHMRRSPCDVIESPCFQPVRFGVVYRPGRVERLRVRRHEPKVGLSWGEGGREPTSRDYWAPSARTVNSSRERYFPLATLTVIVPKSIGVLIASAYPGTCAGSTGRMKNA